MPNRGLILFSATVVALMLAASVAAGLALPAGVELPVHWNVAGEADRYAGKWLALLMLPATAALIAGLFVVLPAIEPRADGLRRSAGLYRRLWAAMMVVLAVTHGVVITVALGWHVPISTVVLLMVGGLFVVVGDQLGKSRRMFMTGIRTPWTLADEDVWIATHRLGGRLMTACGLVFCGLALAAPVADALPLLLGVALAVTVLVPIGYSYLLWRRKTRDAAPR